MTDLQAAAIRVSEGDASAFETIVVATNQKLVRLAARMLGNLADAEDVVQEAYVRAYRSLTTGQFDQRSKVETWLYRIVVNATIDARRKRKRTRTDELVEAGWDGAATAEAIVALRELSSWIAELPDEQQAAPKVQHETREVPCPHRNRCRPIAHCMTILSRGGAR